MLPLWSGNIKPPVELVVGELGLIFFNGDDFIMKEVIDYFGCNYQWLFSGIAVNMLFTFISVICGKLKTDFVKGIIRKTDYVNQEIFFLAPNIFYFSFFLILVISIIVMFLLASIGKLNLRLDLTISGGIVILFQIIYLHKNKTNYNGINKKGEERNYAKHIFVFLLYYDIVFMFLPQKEFFYNNSLMNYFILIIGSGMGVIVLYFCIVHKEYMYNRIEILTSSSVVPLKVSVENIKVTSTDVMIKCPDKNYIKILNRQYIKEIVALRENE